MTQPPKKDRRPWPMTWVAVSIAFFVVVYTFVNVAFRKTETPHLPYEEAQERKSRYFDFDMNGWKWLKAEWAPHRSKGPGSGGIEVRERPRKGRLDQEMPMDLVTVIPRRPRLADDVLRIGSALTAGNFLEITLERGPESKEGFQLDAFLKADDLVVLMVRNRSSASMENQETVRLSLLDEGFPAGSYSATLYTDDAIYEWTFVVD